MAIARGMRLVGSAGLIIAIAFASPAVAAEDDGWIGREFMPRVTCTPKVQNQLIPLKSLSLPFKVQKVNGNWLWVGRAWVKKSDIVALDDATAYYDEYLENHPDSSWTGECLLAASRGELAARERDMRDPTDADSFAALAWLHATCPIEGLREGKRAVELATKACELSSWSDDDTINKLAAAYAEDGDFENAITFQEKALGIAPEKSKRFYRSRLELYQSGKPYRDERISDGFGFKLILPGDRSAARPG
jgi:tetratricopeptide (TPR) repeat protein